MSLIKSFSVGAGDMFYIKHNSDNFSIIDCSLNDENKDKIISEIKIMSKDKNITRFISTHPDEDHIGGLHYLDDEINIFNFYCVKNEAIKDIITPSFKIYCELRDSDKVFNIFKDCSRKWMNVSDDVRGSSGINILWPNTNNKFYKDALDIVKNGGSPNNISPIISYKLDKGVTMIWMGDLEFTFMDKIKDILKLPQVDILFAPHHSRKSGKMPKELLDCLNPKIIIIGEGPHENLNYHGDYNTITQNSAGDITFDCQQYKVHIYVSNEKYSVKFLDDEKMTNFSGYIGTLNL
ncbi:MBL fold metallo-hydrolase [Methanohalophilus sp. RSK]|uniref:MBL fold metallo-hydrolase n=1 Tax=Methanohalophilus sp. RSK TaxID=2485783 RepID=UPI000F43D630|nr:MBL fold metallo-hydrolase [Methanohalophilus sp. RSK]RNI12998.1 MBL fold metallo-hydrolase [Methanohalophilus sp. RSK]